MRIGRLIYAAGLGLCISCLASAAVLAAQAGWVSENGAVRYVDSSGNYVKNAWRDSEGKRYYLDSNGEAAVNTWIDNTYYVDSKGVMVSNAWIHDSGESGLKAEGWYFLGKDGRAASEGWRTVEGARYCFDKDGKMRTGWHYEKGDIYYLGDEDQGYVSTGWHCLAYDEKNRPKEGEFSKEYEEDQEGAAWFYFQSTGKAKRSGSGKYQAAAIQDKKYYFDENGVMLTGWHAVRETAEPGDKEGISRFVYLGGKDEGVLKKQWMKLKEHPADSVDGGILLSSGSTYKGPRKGQEEWYYLESDGTPAFLNSQETFIGRAAAKIGGEAYFFDTYGCLQTGLVRINAGGSGQTGYFGENREDAFMRVGKVKNVQDKAGRQWDFCFGSTGSAKGVGHTGEKDGFLYADGVLVKAEEGSDYQAFDVGGRIYLVNEAGKVQSEDKAYESNGKYAYKIKDDVVYTADEKGNKGAEVKTGAPLPKVTFDYVYTVN